MAAPVTTAYAGGLSLLYAGLQTRVGLYRLFNGPDFGNGASKDKPDGNAELTAITRAGANLGEYLPLSLFLMYLLETEAKVPAKTMATIGAVLAAARISHALSLSVYTIESAKPIYLPLRVLGFVSTIGVIAGSAVYLLKK